MLSSNKMTFSLTCLVMLMAFGLTFVPAALAAIGTEPTVDLGVADVSSAAGGQIEAYPPIPVAVVDAAAVDTATKIDTLISTAQAGDVMFFLKITNEGVASLDARGANLSTTASGVVPVPNPNTLVEASPPVSPANLHISDLSITQYSKLGVSLAESINDADSKIEHRNDVVRDGRNFMVTIDEDDVNAAAAFMMVQLPAGAFQHAAPADVRAAHFDADNSLKSNKESGILRLELVKEEPAVGDPEVVSLVRVADVATRGPDQAGTGGFFSLAAVSGPFNVKVTFTEEPNGAIIDIIDVKRGKVTSVVKGAPFYVRPDASEGNYSTENLPEMPPPTTGRDRRYHSYLLTITPNLAAADETVEVAVKKFDDLVIPAKSWTPPANLSLAHNRYLLIVPVATGAKRVEITKGNANALTALVTGIFLPEGLVVQAGKYLVLTVGTAAQSGVQGSTATLKNKKGAAVDYNIKNEFALPYPGDDLSTLFRNGGTIELSHNNAVGNTGKDAATGRATSETQYTAEALVISEIMWGRDASLGHADSVKSQWIELYNPGAADISIDKEEWILAFYSGPAPATPPTIPAVVATATIAAVAAIPFTVVDTVSNSVPYWLAPGMDGATVASRQDDVKDADDAIVGGVVETFELGTLVSMYRKIDVDGATVSSGTSPDSWAASSDAGTRNLSGLRSGTPGAATPYTAPEATSEPEAAPEPTAPVAKAGDIMISEIMVASNEGRFPQWIEITNGSVGEVSLMGWVVSIANDSADPAVVAASLGIKLDGVTLDAGQSALVVSKLSNRNSGVAARTKDDGNAGALDSNRIVDAQSQVNPPTATYSLLSEMAFQISLQPPLTGGITDRGNVVGNLGGGWELPMSEGDRSSIIRREMNDSGKILGTDAAGWVLASDTGDGGAFLDTFYGDKDDVGTPGYDAGGALPVELSGFGAKRDPLTGAVVITWATQSELNNAGFFIKRSQQQKSKFVVVNPTMIAGAGTTAEKQSYTYTDATADPNVIYYYQIEDVSLDGNRQTLTRAHRLKGHIGAAGKATTTWGDLKSSRE